MDAREAMAHVERMREQLARVETFRAFRAASTLCTAALAFLAAAVQAYWDLNQPSEFLLLWIVTAGLSIVIVGVEMRMRIMSSDSVLARDAAILATRQFVPCVVAGAMMTLAIHRFSPDAVRLLPGLWAILFSLGIFASRPGLPRAINLAGGYYLLCGLFILAAADNQSHFETWPMPLSFGVGQLLTSGILYFSGERHDASY